MTQETTEQRADLHVHYDPIQKVDLLEVAAQKQVVVLGLLQRRLVQLDRMEELTAQGRKLGITVLPGVEIFFRTPRGIHYELIGLDFNPRDPKLFDLVDPRGNTHLPVTREKVAFQSGFLQERFGFDMTPVPENQAILDHVHSGLTAETAYNLSLAATLNPNNAAALSRYQRKRADKINAHYKHRPWDIGNIAKTLYWLHFSADSTKSELQAESAYQIWGEPLDPKEFIRTIHCAGGVVEVAHPHFQHQPGEPTPFEFLDELLDLGVDGLEGWHTEPLSRDLAEIGSRRKLLILGGSNFDLSYDPPNIEMGFGHIDKRDMFIPPTIVDQIREYKQRVKSR